MAILATLMIAVEIGLIVLDFVCVIGWILTTFVKRWSLDKEQSEKLSEGIIALSFFAMILFSIIASGSSPK